MVDFSPEEIALQRQQLRLLRFQQTLLQRQDQQQQALMPFFAQQMGLNIRTDANGNITAVSQRPNTMQAQQDRLQRQTLAQQLQYLQGQAEDYRRDAPLRAQQRQVQTLLGQRSLAALRGELPVDPALERELTTQRRELGNRLRDQLGTGWETSSPGIEAMQRYSEGAASLRSAAQTGQLTLAEQLGLARSGQNINQTNAERGGLAPFLSLAELGLGQQNQQFSGAQSSIFGIPNTNISSGGNIAAGYGAAISPFLQQRQINANLDIANQNAASQRSAGIWGAVGSIGGALLGSLPFLSSRTVKDLPFTRLNDDHGIPLYIFRYKDTGEERIGTVAEEISASMPWAIGDIRGIPAVYYGVL